MRKLIAAGAVVLSLFAFGGTLGATAADPGARSNGLSNGL